MKKAIIFTLGVIIVSIIIINALFSSILKPSPTDPNAWKTNNNRTMAYVMIQNFVKDYLRSPASAKFEWITEPDCVITKNGFDYSISSWVDSQNAFGAMLRTRFSGIVRQVDKDNWLLLELELDGVSIVQKKEEAVKIEPRFDVKMNIQNWTNISFTINTNLPNETNIMLGIRDINTEEFLRQASGVIMSGTVTLGPFPNMSAGKYILDITVPIISSQKQSVKNILGNNGENLIGNLVEDFMGSKIVTVKAPLEIPNL